MRNAWVVLIAATVLCAVTTTWTVVGQTAGGAAAEKDSEPKNYISVTPDKLERYPAQFEGQYVQVPDIFGGPVTRFPGVLGRYGITPQTHFGFRTHRALGSNMICFVPRDNKDAQAFFETPVVPETQIYMMGRVGPRLDTDDGMATVFYVDRIVRGHNPPPAEVKKKPVRMTVEWSTDRGAQKQEYLIPESGKRYVIPDPYDKNKTFYITLQF